MKSTSWLKQITILYLILANSIVLIFIVFLGIFLAWWYSDDYRKDNFWKRDFASGLIPEVRREYAHLGDKEVNELLSSTWNMRDGGWVYEQWTGFRERARVSKFVNVNEFGVRSNGNAAGGPSSLNGSIWMFGGSTTFGYGVADNETIPASLQQIINHDVVNFGRGYYYSAQENMLLKQLVVTGFVPSKAIFLDGINERCNIDVYQTEMAALFNTAQAAYNWSTSNVFGPVKFLAHNILLKLGASLDGHGNPVNADIARLSCSNFGVEKKMVEVLHSNLVERKLLCQQYNIDCVTFVQPFAGVHGIHANEKALPVEARMRLKTHYDEFKGVFSGMGAISIVNALDEKKTNAYIDDVHYSSSANKLIANAIANFILPSSLKH